MGLIRFIVVVGLVALQAPSTDHVRAAFGVAAKDSLDGTDFAETAGYRELVGALLELKPNDVAAQQPTPIDFARSISEPASQHGAWISAQGYVTGKETVRLETPIGNVKQIERVVLKLDHDRAVVCDLIGDPPPYKVQADTVKISGVFFRTVAFENKNKAVVTFPYMLARSMELVDTPASSMGKSLIKGGQKLLAGVLLGLFGVVLLIFYLRRSARSETS